MQDTICEAPEGIHSWVRLHDHWLSCRIPFVRLPKASTPGQGSMTIGYHAGYHSWGSRGHPLLGYHAGYHSWGSRGHPLLGKAPWSLAIMQDTIREAPEGIHSWVRLHDHWLSYRIPFVKLPRTFTPGHVHGHTHCQATRWAVVSPQYLNWVRLPHDRHSLQFHYSII